MNFFTRTLTIAGIVCIIHSTESKGLKTNNPSPPTTQVSSVLVRPPVIQPPLIKIATPPKTYAQALDNIRTKMPTHTIIGNNTLTHEFINFVTSLHLSTIETVALLEAGAHLHAVWTGNNNIDQQILLSLQDNIASIINNRTKPDKEKKPIIPNPVQQKPTEKPLLHHKPTQQQSKESTVKEVVPAQKHFATNNLIILLDPEKVETIENNQRAMVQDALLALYEQAAPLIITSNIWYIITNLRKTIGENNLRQLRASSYNQTMPLAQQIITSHHLHENQLLIILLSLITFDTQNFNCYFHTSDNLVLIIPKQYIKESISSITDLNLKDQAKACGFNPTVITPIDNLHPDNLVQQLTLQQAIPKHKTQFIKNLTSLFIPQKKHGVLISPMQDTLWTIFLAGHGGAYYQTIGTIREQLAINKQNLNFFKNALVKNKNDHKAADNKALAEANIKKYEKIIHNKAHWPNTQLLVGAANIAGIPMDDFATLIEFFDENLNVGFLHYTSCFAGGYNQTFVNDTLSDLNVNFITSTQGVDERQTNGIKLELIFSSQAPYISLSKKPFTAFFKLLRLFLTNQPEFVKIKEYKKEPVAKILRTIVSNVDEKNQPFVRFPGAGVFGALSLGKNTKNLTNVMVKAHEIENKPINLTDTSTNAIIVNPSHINVLLNFGKNIHCAIISPTPEIITPSHEAIHIFTKINFESSLQSFIFNVVSLNARIHLQTFVIKELTGILYHQSGLPSTSGTTHNITNLIIQIQNIPGHIVRSKAIIVFELNGIIYQGTMEINNFEDPHLENYITSIKLTPTTDILSIAHAFLSSKEVTKLKKPITVESIANFINAKIGQEKQPSLFEQPGENMKALREFTKRKIKK